jgi:hypothetical protein
VDIFLVQFVGKCSSLHGTLIALLMHWDSPGAASFCTRSLAGRGKSNATKYSSIHYPLKLCFDCLYETLMADGVIIFVTSYILIQWGFGVFCAKTLSKPSMGQTFWNQNAHGTIETTTALDATIS